MLYFIRSGQYVKIGVSANPWNRLVEFQTANPEPLEMLAIAPGDYGFESELHRLFAEHRHNGEWFLDSEPIREFIGFMRRLFPVLQESPKAAITAEVQEGGEDDSEWRIERRSYTKKDGTMSVYQNYRLRKTDRDPVTGERRIKYRPGGRVERNSNGYYRERFQIKDDNGNPVTYITKSGKVGYKKGSRYIPAKLVTEG
jgi:hypothetical protein